MNHFSEDGISKERTNTDDQRLIYRSLFYAQDKIKLLKLI